MSSDKKEFRSMNVLKRLVKENATGNRLEAVIYKNGSDISIQYFVNHTFKHEETFTGRNLPFVESQANAWLSGVDQLNG